VFDKAMKMRKFKPKMLKRIVPFNKRSRSQRKRSYIRVKNEIRRQAPVIGGLFSTHSYINTNTAWLDIWFLGKKPLVMYNVTLDTTLQAYRDAIWNAAFDATFAANKELLAQELEMEVLSRDAKTGVVTTQFPDPLPRTEFGGLTSMQWQKAQEERLADSGQIQVFEKWTLHRDYSCGTGLHATIHEPYLTINAINRFIKIFLENEAEYKGEQSFQFTYDQCMAAEKSGQDSNAIVDPLDWEAVGRSELREEYDFSNAIRNPYAALRKSES
jgi:hypothetical protein